MDWYVNSFLQLQKEIAEYMEKIRAAVLKYITV